MKNIFYTLILTISFFAFGQKKELKQAQDRIKRLDETLEGITNKLDAAWGIYMQFKEPKL